MEFIEYHKPTGKQPRQDTATAQGFGGMMISDGDVKKLAAMLKQMSVDNNGAITLTATINEAVASGEEAEP